ncbi:MAG: hypothetical protein IKL85_01360 [Lentisphaeria bacterium]|nr:hypothetical protein [Lentisphaeria bacterium]
MANQLPISIWGVFKARSNELAKGNSGAALAVTLSFVMPIYLMVIGIYGVGEVVRNKIELQNAADAAAYSASVVQADYLSRMATVNKAMAWTYVDLQKRSLDLAMDTFCATVFAKFSKDFATCVSENSPCHMHAPGLNFNCGTDELVNDSVLKFAGTGVGLPLVAKEFNGQGMLSRFLLNQTYHIAEANIKGKGTVTNLPKVMTYSYNIIKMTKKLVNLRDEYQKKVKETAQQIAIANMMECKDDYYVKVHMGDINLSFLTMPGTADNEQTFIAFADPTLKSFKPKDVFGRGTDVWMKQKSPVGFWRVYQQQKKVLYAEWDWFWTKWRHVQIWTVSLHLPPVARGSGGWKRGHPKIKGTDFPLIKENMPIGLVVTPAIPITLLPTFFGKSGTITVAIVRKTANPLAKFDGILSNPQSLTASGILSAFNPSVANGEPPRVHVRHRDRPRGLQDVQQGQGSEDEELRLQHRVREGKPRKGMEPGGDRLGRRDAAREARLGSLCRRRQGSDLRPDRRQYPEGSHARQEGLGRCERQGRRPEEAARLGKAQAAGRPHRRRRQKQRRKQGKRTETELGKTP